MMVNKATKKSGKSKRGRPKKAVKYTKTINLRLTHSQWLKALNAAERAHLEPSVYIRKVLLDFLTVTAHREAEK